MFFPRLTQRDASSQNVVKLSPDYCQKTNRFHFAVGLYSDNAQRTSKHGKNISHATSRVLLCSYHVLKSSVRFNIRVDARQIEIYLLTKTRGFSVNTRSFQCNRSLCSLIPFICLFTWSRCKNLYTAF